MCIQLFNYLQVNQTKAKSSPCKKLDMIKNEIPAALIPDSEYQESNSGSYSTTTTLSMNKTDLIVGRMLSLPPTLR